MQVAPESSIDLSATANTWALGYQACIANCCSGSIPKVSAL